MRAYMRICQSQSRVHLIVRLGMQERIHIGMLPYTHMCATVPLKSLP